MKTVFLINGPPRSGKNTLAGLIADRFASTAIIGFSHHLKRCVHSIHYGNRGWSMDPDYFDATKDESVGLLGGRSWRDAYIDFSENYIKPRYGADWFGAMFIRSALAAKVRLIVAPDSGFREEAAAVVKIFGPEQVHLIRLHRDNTDFQGDSRGYIDLSDLGVQTIDLTNNGGLDSLANSASHILESLG